MYILCQRAPWVAERFSWDSRESICNFRYMKLFGNTSLHDYQMLDPSYFKKTALESKQALHTQYDVSDYI